MGSRIDTVTHVNAMQNQLFITVYFSLEHGICCLLENRILLILLTVNNTLFNLIDKEQYVKVK